MNWSPLRADLVEEQRAPRCFGMLPFPSSCRKQECIVFSNIYCESLVELLEVKNLQILPDWVSLSLSLPGVFVHAKLPVVPSGWGFPNPGWFPQSSWVSTLEAVTLCGHLSVSSLGGSSFPCVRSSLSDPRRVVNVSIWSALYYLLEWGGDFQAL